jgi:hypothetical protein
MPVTVITLRPVAALAPAASVSCVDVVDEVGANVAVTPLGTPERANATLPAKPPDGATVIVDIPDAPCATERLLGLAESV